MPCSTLQLVLELDPEHPDALHLLGIIAYTEGENTRSLDYITEAIDIAPKKENYHNSLGLTLMALSKNKEAYTQFEEELNINPNHDVSLANIGGLLQHEGNHELVKDQIESEKAKTILKPLLEHPYVQKAGQNLKYDIQITNI